jgi:uncharacterized protein (TIGR02001 family)
MAILILAPAGALAAIEADNFSAAVTLTSDSVYRGVSQSREDPAVQGSFDFENEAGLFVGVWASSAQFPSPPQHESPAGLELDYYVGYRLDLSDAWGGDVGLTRYTYPSSDAAFDYDYSELKLSIGYDDVLTGSLAWSADAFGTGRESRAYELLGRWPMGKAMEIVGGIGFYDLDDVFGRGYAYWNLSLSRFLGRFVLTASYIDTAGQAERIWGRELTAARLVVSLSASIQ